MSIGERLTSGWQGRQVTPRRVILFLVGIAVLLAVVLFNQDIVNLFKWLRGGAAGGINPFGGLAEQSWEATPVTNFGRSNAKLIDVTLPPGNPNAGKRYLYLIGGIETKLMGDPLQNRLSLIKSVERIQLDVTTGAILTGATWEKNDAEVSWGQMYAGHAEFGVLRYGNYLYVISGDIHIPDPRDPQFATDSPLLFSTIERLDLTNESAGWQPVALLTGVNFYPEIIQFNDRLHIIGGIYGNPFSKGYSWFAGDYEIKDPLLLTDDEHPVDLWKWDDKYKNLPVIGDMPVALPNGGIGANVITGQGGQVVPPGGLVGVIGTGGSVVSKADDGVHIQQVGNQNLADTLTRGLLSGKFVTSVSEHYIINPTTLAVDFKGELGNKFGQDITQSGNDYLGHIYDTWQVGRVIHIAHLRVVIDVFFPNQTTSVYSVHPAPQGRYGHKAFISNGKLYVVGGASWSSPIERAFVDGSTYYRINIYTFWVNDDAIHPITQENEYGRSVFDLLTGYLPNDTHDYQYLGNITYQWSNASEVWQGTNSYGNSPALESRYAFQSGLQPQGRAFFAWAKLNPAVSTTEFLAIGGLENNTTVTESFYPFPGLRVEGGGTTSSNFGISVLLADRVEKFTEEAKGWEPRANLSFEAGYTTYGATATGGGPAAILFGGQTVFLVDPEKPFTNDHVPAYERDVSTKVAGYLDFGGDTGEGAWWPFHETNPSYAAAYPATLDVRTTTTGGGETIYLYKACGSIVGGGDDLPNTIRQVEVFGPIQYGGRGIVDWSKSFITIEPARGDPDGYYNWPGTGERTPEVLADRHDYAVVTVNLKDYYGDPATSAGLDRVPGGLAVSLYTKYTSGLIRSPKPAVGKNIKNEPTSPTNPPDWIRIRGLPTSSTGGLPSPEWDNQFVLVDTGNGNDDDHNPDTGAGQVQFYISSGYHTYDENGIQPNPIEALAYVIDTNETFFAALADGALGTPSHDNELIFTRHGVPGLKSTMEATSPVKADGVDGVAESTVKGTLIDDYGDPVPGRNTAVISNRNLDTDPEGHLITHDIIDPLTQYANENGIAIYTVKSNLIGRADLQGYYAPPIAIPEDVVVGLPNWVGYKTVGVMFTNQGQIISLFPASAKQGQTIKEPAPMVAVGDLVQWDALKTTVTFLPPGGISFLYQKGSDGWDTIENLMLYADGFPTNLKLLGDETLAGAQLYLKIVEGGGSFFTAGYPDNITVNTDLNGNATFSYIPGDVPGILKIEVKLNDANGTKQGELWLPISKSPANVYMVVDAAPKHVTETAPSTEITAKLLNVHGNPADYGLTFTFTKDDGANGYFTPASGQVTDGGSGDLDLLENGKVVIRYTRAGTEAGLVHIFATATYTGGSTPETASDRILILKSISGTPADQTIIYDTNNMHVGGTIPQMSLTFDGTGVTVGTAAPVGVWTFLVSTDIGLTTPTEETAAFLVEPVSPTTPTILTLDPAEGLRGQGYDIEIDAINTNFVWSGPAADQSQVTFTPVGGNDLDSVTTPIVSNPTIPNNWTHLTVHWDIAADAKVGNWNVEVSTPNVIGPPDVVGMPFDHDFKVTTESGYSLDLTTDHPDPPTIIRNGEDIVVITATAVFVEENGDVTLLGGKDITFDKGADGGSLAPGGTQTKPDGSQTCDYQTDGPLPTTAIANIQVSVIVDATKTLIGAVQITRTGMNPDEIDITKSWISATTPMPASGLDEDASLVTVTLRNNLGQLLNGKTVALSTNYPQYDTILTTHDNPQETGTDGQATDGQAIFEVKSIMPVHTSTITATFGNGLQKSVDILFEDPALLSRRFLSLTVPFQARDYDNKVWVVVKHNGAEKNIDEEYTKNAHNVANPDLLVGLQAVKFYLYTTTSDSYTVWVKGKNHLAASKTDIKAVASDPPGTVITVDFGSLKIGDIATAGTTEIRPGYHDNTIGKMSGLTSTEDLGLLYSNWFKAFDLGDFTQDGIINSIDMLHLFLNWGAGATLP